MTASPYYYRLKASRGGPIAIQKWRDDGLTEEMVEEITFGSVNEWDWISAQVARFDISGHLEMFRGFDVSLDLINDQSGE